MNMTLTEKFVVRFTAKRSLYGSRLDSTSHAKTNWCRDFLSDFSTGVANSLILSIPLLFSVPAGVLLGISVCLIACPGMRNDLAQFKQEQREASKRLLARKGRKNAFTMYE